MEGSPNMIKTTRCIGNIINPTSRARKSSSLHKKEESIPNTSFVLGGNNDRTAIESLRLWSDYSRVLQTLKPGKSSESGFLSKEEDLVDVLLADYESCRQLGVSKETMTNWLRNIIVCIEKDEIYSGETISYNEQLLKVNCFQNNGWQNSPLPGPITLSSKDIEIINIKNGVNITTTEMHPDLIELYGFFEGKGKYRNSPEALVEIFTGNK